MFNAKYNASKTLQRIMGLCILLVVSTQTSLASEEANFNIEQLFQILQKKEATVIHYSEIKTLSFLETQLTQEGELEFRPPDYLRRELTLPIKEKTIINGDEISITTPGGVRNISLSGQPVVRALISAILAPMTGNTDEVRKWFNIRLQGDVNKWVVELIPSKAPLKNQLSSMILKGNNDQLQSIETIESNQDSSLMILRQ